MSQELESPAPAWRPLNKVQRRVLGVLIEKAKTTPDAYPMSLNGLTTGCNQKSNRDPQMNLEGWEVEEAIDQLREMGAVAEVHGDGRVVKFRHYGKDWLGCEGNELAIMAELLLRGPQTVGELRGRAARMGKIPDMGSLQPLLDELQQKKLVVPLTPRGRGQVVTHGLFNEKELNEQRQQMGDGRPVAMEETAPPESPSAPAPAAQPVAASMPAPSAPASPAPASSAADSQEIAALRAEVAELKAELERVKKDVEDLWSSIT
ncbi:YceH family protein [Bremerella cremea]|uniref:YceH family protein n=1 Tax=Bremerella cremea TaxID=1031537 RepID=UPI0031EB98D7